MRGRKPRTVQDVGRTSPSPDAEPQFAAQRADRDDNSRVLALSDGVFAIALTILVLGIGVPKGVPSVSGAVLDLWPKLLSYAISFVVIAIFWMAHHRVFRDLTGHDGALLWLNVVFLLLIGFLPFPVALLGEYGDQAFAVIFYDLSMIVTSLTLLGLSLYAGAHPQLYHDGRVPADQRAGMHRALVVPVVMSLSILIAGFSALAAQFVWTLIFPAMHLIGQNVIDD